MDYHILAETYHLITFEDINSTVRRAKSVGPEIFDRVEIEKTGVNTEDERNS